MAEFFDSELAVIDTDLGGEVDQAVLDSLLAFGGVEFAEGRADE